MNKDFLNLSTKLSINQMLLSNLHIGHKKRFFNVHMKPYLLGSRQDYHVLNIKRTPHQARILAMFIINIISKRETLLIVKNRDIYSFRDLINLRRLYYSDCKWIGGSLTNFRKVRNSLKFKKLNNHYNSLAAMRYFPSLVFFFDPNLSKWAVSEACNLEIPIAAVLDSSSNFSKQVNYPLVGNTKSFEASFLYLNLLLNSVLRGQQKEILKILRIV